LVLPGARFHVGDFVPGHLDLVFKSFKDPVIDAAGHVAFPDRYLSNRGQLLEHAPFCERDLRAPGAPLLVEADDEDTEVVVRHRGGLTRYTYRNHPFDVVGWAGCLYPFALSIHDFEPLTGRIHQPPPVHQTFAGPSFVVCSEMAIPFEYALCATDWSSKSPTQRSLPVTRSKASGSAPDEIIG